MQYACPKKYVVNEPNNITMQMFPIKRIPYSSFLSTCNVF